MEFHEYIYDNLGYGTWKEYFNYCRFACNNYDGTVSPEIFVERMFSSGFFDEEFFYNYLCYVSDRAGIADANREEFVTIYLVAFDDFYKSFESEYFCTLEDYLDINNCYDEDVNVVLDYADVYCSTLLDVYMEKHMASALPPLVSEESAVTLEPVKTPEPAETLEPIETPELSEMAGTVTPAGAETELPYDNSLLLQELHKTNMLLSVIIFVLLGSWLVGKARNIVKGMTNDGKTG